MYELLCSELLCVCVFCQIFCPLFLHGIWVSAAISCYYISVTIGTLANRINQPCHMSLLPCRHVGIDVPTSTGTSQHLTLPKPPGDSDRLEAMHAPWEVCFLSFPTWNNGKKSVKSMVSVNLRWEVKPWGNETHRWEWRPNSLEQVNRGAPALPPIKLKRVNFLKKCLETVPSLKSTSKTCLWRMRRMFCQEVLVFKNSKWSAVILSRGFGFPEVDCCSQT